MVKRGLGREQIHDTAWGESYPHPFVSCLMPGIAVLALAALALFGYQLWQLSLPRDTPVPLVEGVKVDDAVAELSRAHLNAEVLDQRVHSETVPAGAVISVNPEPGRQVKVGRVIRLIVSAGSAFTNVPDVRELSQSVARERLRAADLVIAKETYTPHPTIPFDRVIAISPRQGTRLERMSTVELTISQGAPIKEPPAGDDGDVPLRSTVVTVDLPTDGPPKADVRIDVTDDDGLQTVYQQEYSAGETLVETVIGTGEMTIQVYYGDRLILTRKF